MPHLDHPSRDHGWTSCHGLCKGVQPEGTTPPWPCRQRQPCHLSSCPRSGSDVPMTRSRDRVIISLTTPPTSHMTDDVSSGYPPRLRRDPHTTNRLWAPEVRGVVEAYSLELSPLPHRARWPVHIEPLARTSLQIPRPRRPELSPKPKESSRVNSSRERR